MLILQLLKNSLLALAQFVVAGHHINHQAVSNFAKSRHGQRRYQIQADFLCRAGFETGGACNSFSAGVK